MTLNRRALDAAMGNPGALSCSTQGLRAHSSHNPLVVEPVDVAPALHDHAFHGPIGDFVRAAAPHTEADPAAILISLLLGYGTALHRGPHVLAGNDRHPCALNAVIVGKTARAGKGTSWAVAREVLVRMDPGLSRRIVGGFGSGESIVDFMRDPLGDHDRDAPTDTRALVYEPEFARVLRVVGRDRSIMGAIIRNAWDGQPLEARSRGAGAVVASRYHMSFLAHITAEELRKSLTSTEVYGGTGNRFLYVRAERARRLPRGGNVPNDLIDDAAEEFRHNLAVSRERGPVVRTPDAEELWADLYNKMGDDDPSGLVGALIARAEPQTLRLSLTYALASGSAAISAEHLHAAWAVWTYCRASVESIFGAIAGDPMRDKILGAIRASGDVGLSRTDVTRTVLSGHADSPTVTAALQSLASDGLVQLEREQTGGRARQIFRATAD